MKEQKIWDAYNAQAQTFKTAIETASMLLRIDDIVSGIKKKQAPGAGKTPSKPTIKQEGDADNEQMIPCVKISGQQTKPARILSCIQRADPLVQRNSSFQVFHFHFRVLIGGVMKADAEGSCGGLCDNNMAETMVLSGFVGHEVL
ncbi:TCP-1/cpn60 chaperonin family protein [Actinidia rufa]|uniref:TCP-1/cpn60 chaperonin family protein n=1 Tax=Actinidia rufa TaxID=165716 RepID=A0A7J0GAJ0_9ERIC|nr:TCP-1/cpn60 chaperonin family protein [Actinidia rufa]